MKKAPTPENDQQRIGALNTYRVLDTMPEDRFDNITKIAAQLTDCPISLISLIDRDRQWFKSRFGLEATETPRDISYCGHAIMGDDIFIVEDATEDERFKDNPLCIEAPNVVFYAGVPLINKAGYKLGTLCVIDHKTRKIDDKQIESLKLLAQQVVELFELRLSELDYKEVCEAGEIAHWFFDLASQTIIWSEKMFEIFNVDPKEGEPDFEAFQSMIFPEDRHKLLGAIGLCIQEGVPYKVEHRFFSKGRSIRWLEGQGEAIRDKRGNIIALNGVSQDITDKKQKELDLAQSKKELNDSNTYLQLAMEGGDLGIWDWFIDEDRVKFDEGWAKILGLEFATMKMEFSTWQERVHPDDLESCFIDINNYLEGKTESYENIHRMKHVDGHWVYTQGKAKISARDDNGKPTRLTGTQLDMTAIKTQELELIKEKERALEAEKAKSLFLANMSHEIRTPMNGIIGMTQLLEDSLTVKEDLEKLDIIQNSSKALLTIINDILDFSKIEAGKLELEYRNFSIKSLVENQVKLFSTLAIEKGIEISSHISRDIPDLINLDEVRVKQVINNLLSNAIKFTKKGVVSINVSNLENNKLQITVKDSGVGIDKVALEKLFQDFTQADNSTTRRFGGTGLGLSICKKLVESMGGEISVESIVGQGAEFTFTIKYKEATQSKIKVPQKIDSKDIVFSDFKILLVEDNLVNQKVASGFLKKLGIVADLAVNGQECLSALENKTYDLVIMDCHMPVMDGYEATKKIIEKYGNNKPKIVALTASTMKEDVEHCFEVGMDDFISKPVTIDTLNKVLQKHLSK